MKIKKGFAVKITEEMIGKLISLPIDLDIISDLIKPIILSNYSVEQNNFDKFECDAIFDPMTDTYTFRIKTYDETYAFPIIPEGSTYSCLSLKNVRKR